MTVETYSTLILTLFLAAILKASEETEQACVNTGFKSSNTVRSSLLAVKMDAKGSECVKACFIFIFF